MRASAFVYAALMRERLLSIDTLRFMKDPSKINILSFDIYLLSCFALLCPALLGETFCVMP